MSHKAPLDTQKWMTVHDVAPEETTIYLQVWANDFSQQKPPAPLCVQCGKFTIVYPDNYLATRVSMEVIVTTLPKTNIAPENGWLEY